MLKAENIQKSYNGLEVLKGINLSIEKGEVVSIVGASGAGKSTLLHILGTLDTPDQGKVMLNDVEVSSLSQKRMSKFRNEEIGFIFQFHNLFPEFTALENVCIPAYIKGSKGAEKRAEELLKVLGLADRKDHKPSELSGGEQQRVSVARALINDPSIVFADEPSGNLDSQSADDLHKLFFDLRNKIGQTFVIVTHNMELAGMADRKLEIKDGIITS
ncbi:MAG: ABC transporter ATP-binding protein [Ekhidna sp.]|uniref:ABC transporter ATP-binding protein n=1 Tax=Ekhidna sp. TaxID=2608089 RepID=UPI0032ED9AF5